MDWQRGVRRVLRGSTGFLRWLHSLREVRHRSAFVVTNASIDFMSIVSDAHPRVPGRGR